MRQLGRIVATAALVPWLAAAYALPPEHVHESESADEHSSVAHRHTAFHDQESRHHDDAAEYPDDPSASRGEESVVWIDQVCLAEATHTFSHFPATVPSPIDAVAAPLERPALVIADQATLAHGPPRPSVSLRAPPSFVL